LREVLEIPGEAPGIQQIVVVHSGDQKIGVVVDMVIGDHQTVVKNLGKMYRNAEGVSGATILGDGSVALILDVKRLVRLADFLFSQQHA
jgi:two-component system chemotaxis sensor kinase CheA